MKLSISTVGQFLIMLSTFQLGWMPAPVTAEPGSTDYSAANIVRLLESGAIGPGGSDQILKSSGNGISVSRNGDYSIFSIEGLDATDNITIISNGGMIFYANYGSCSQSKTYFNNKSEYNKYIQEAN